MGNYLIRRLLLLPITLFFIVLINFIIINLAPGDPVTIAEISPEGNATRSADHAMAFGSDERYLQFRERYGLTLPILFNDWPFISVKKVQDDLNTLVEYKMGHNTHSTLTVEEADNLRINLGDQARFIMPKLLQIINDPKIAESIRSTASRFFARGGTRQAYLGGDLSESQKAYNNKIGIDNSFLRSIVITSFDDVQQIKDKVAKMNQWVQENKKIYNFEPTTKEKVFIFFFETRFFRYMGRVLTLDFGTLRNDDNKTVISEVTRRFKYSLTLALLPMLITFVICQIFGCLMAYKQNKWQDYTFSIFFLIMYALPVFVVAPFLIAIVAFDKNFPFTDIPIPISGFTSPDRIYNNLTSYQRLIDISEHIFLPLVAIIYGSMAAQARLSRTAVLEVMRQDYVRTAKAKGLSKPVILWKYIGRNASITIVTSIASSLGVVLGGSLIVETLFEINGFGKFFYDAVINRDYNVIMFSSLAGSLLSLLGFLAADIAYTVLDPRLTLE